jgi:hypothetical protein
MKKELDMKVRKVISKTVAERYKKSRKKEKSKILDEFTNITGYNRSYASWLLNNLGKKLVGELSIILCLLLIVKFKVKNLVYFISFSFKSWYSLFPLILF